MNKFILLISLVSLALVSCQKNNEADQGEISITIKSDLEEVSSASFRGYYNLWERHDRVQKDSQNTIQFTKTVTGSELIGIGVKGFYSSSYFYLEKGESLSMYVEGQKLVIEGDSREARQNRLLQDLSPIKSKLARYFSSLTFYKKNLAKGRESRKPKEVDVDAVYRELESMLVQFKADNKDYSKYFIRFVELDTKYLRVKNELNMPNYKVKTYHPFTAEDMVMLDECLEDSKDEVAILSMYYRSVISAYIDYLRIHDPKGLLSDGKNWLANEVNVAKYVPNEKTQQFVVADNLMALYYYNGKRPEYIETVLNHAGQWASFITEQAQGVKGKPGKKRYTNAVEYPVLEGIDVDGNLRKLEEFRGQWVYVDMWATWCGPCNFEITYLNEMKHRLKEYNVAFIGMSVDKDKDREKLLKLIKEKNLGGVQLQNSNIEAVYSQFAVMGIPHFAIISPEGKLFINKAPTPSTGIPDRLLKSLAGLKK